MRLWILLKSCSCPSAPKPRSNTQSTAHGDLRMSHLTRLKQLEQLTSVRPVQLKPLVVLPDAPEQKFCTAVAIRIHRVYELQDPDRVEMVIIGDARKQFMRKVVEVHMRGQSDVPIKRPLFPLDGG